MENYLIRKTEIRDISINSDEWNRADVAKVTTVNWSEYSYAPYTEARILYNDKGIYVKFASDEDNLITTFTYIPLSL